MQTAIVVSDPRDWPDASDNVEVVAAREYLTQPRWTEQRGLRVYNLCRSYRYQSLGYYVSLLAAARKHRPFPTLATILEMRSRAVVRTADQTLDELMQTSLASLKSDRFTLSVYFGKNLARRHQRLALRLYELFPAPLLRAQFTRKVRWRLASVSPIAAREVPKSHQEFVFKAARDSVAGQGPRRRTRRRPRYDLAMLQNPAEEFAPSDERALRKFERAAEAVGFGIERITREDYSRLPEFDALFIRETTYVNHHTFRFSQRAEAEGLVVIDDPQSILRCTNKVFLTEALKQAGVPTPKTLILDRPDVDAIQDSIGYPCVLKHPDSAFSQGVVKCRNEEEFREKAADILERSDLLLVQEFLPSDYDWRIGVLDGQALYACRYFMARSHWQIVSTTSTGGKSFGKVDTMPIEEAPPKVVRAAVRAAATIGDGLYGVDLKSSGKRVVVIEVNDNPSLDAGYEDKVLKDELYRIIMRSLLRRVEERKERV